MSIKIQSSNINNFGNSTSRYDNIFLISKNLAIRDKDLSNNFIIFDSVILLMKSFIDWVCFFIRQHILPNASKFNFLE